MKRDLSIIIPNWNGFPYLKDCIKSIKKAEYKYKIEIIIVDNASLDDSIKWVERYHKDILVLKNKKNLGFAKACNQGAKAARGEFLIFLNNDTEVQPGWLDEMIKCSQLDANIAIVGAKLLYPDNTIQHAGVAITNSPHPIFPYHMHSGKPSNFDEAKILKEYQAVTGACMLVRKDIFENAGGFEP